MKQTTLEDLYYGNINPCETSFVRGTEYGKCFDKVTELSKSVCSQLIEEYINKMNELESAYTRILSETHISQRKDDRLSINIPMVDKNFRHRSQMMFNSGFLLMSMV